MAFPAVATRPATGVRHGGTAARNGRAADAALRLGSPVDRRPLGAPRSVLGDRTVTDGRSVRCRHVPSRAERDPGMCHVPRRGGRPEGPRDVRTENALLSDRFHHDCSLLLDRFHHSRGRRIEPRCSSRTSRNRSSLSHTIPTGTSHGRTRHVGRHLSRKPSPPAFISADSASPLIEPSYRKQRSPKPILRPVRHDENQRAGGPLSPARMRHWIRRRGRPRPLRERMSPGRHITPIGRGRL